MSTATKELADLELAEKSTAHTAGPHAKINPQYLSYWLRPGLPKP